MASTGKTEDGAEQKAGKQHGLLRVDQLQQVIHHIQQCRKPVALIRGLRKDRQIHFIKTAKGGLSKANQERFNKTVLVVRRIISKQGMVTGTEVDIKSTLLRDLLLEINKDVSGLQLNKSPPEADPTLLFHSLPGLEAKKKQELESDSPNHTLIEHVSIVQQFVYEDFGSRIADLTSLLEHNEITYHLLWAIFPPRCLIFTKKTLLEQPQVMRVDSATYQETQAGKYFELDCQFIAHDGEDFGISEHSVKIMAFEGTLKVDDLDGFPLQYHHNEHSVREEFIARGRKYISLLGSECQEYSGPAAKEVEILGNNKIVKFTNRGSDVLPFIRRTNRNPTKMSREDLLMCPATCLGFSFLSKTWAAFLLGQLKPVSWNLEAFQKLVIGPKQRTLVYALVKSHGRGQSEQDDIIQDKGKGLVGLLSGSPGVGKTLTAEAVAEVTKRPLYVVSAGELGKDLEAVDQRLDTVLEITKKWKCVLLLDEADVFLQTRSMVDLERNALVSIFLRRLEYYQGILILTTNRISTIDPAFQSRIHFSIQYPDLDIKSRKMIWQNFINSRSEPAEITVEDFDRLAEVELNGRQIKNAVACASSLAWEDNTSLAMRHIDTVLDALAEFSIASGEK